MKMLIILFLIQSSLFAAKESLDLKDFKLIRKTDKEFYLLKVKKLNPYDLEKGAQTTILKLNVSGNEASLLKVSKLELGPPLFCVVYKAGESGTSSIIEERRCAVFNKALSRFEGDIPYQYLPKGKSLKEFQQPKLSFENGKLIVKEGGIVVKKLTIGQK